MGRKTKYSADTERKIEESILCFFDSTEKKIMRSDAEIATICRQSGIDINTKYVERARRRLGLSACGRVGRKSDDLRRQHDIDVLMLSRMFGQGQPPGGALAWQKYKSQMDFSKNEKKDKWTMILNDQRGAIMPWAAGFAFIVMLNISIILNAFGRLF